jgi:hypothetical protein
MSSVKNTVADAGKVRLGGYAPTLPPADASKIRPSTIA